MFYVVQAPFPMLLLISCLFYDYSIWKWLIHTAVRAQNLLSVFNICDRPPPDTQHLNTAVNN